LTWSLALTMLIRKLGRHSNPLCDDFRDPLHKARAPIKELTSPPRTLPRAEPPLPPPVVLTVNSTSGCLSSQTRASLNSTKVPSSSPFACCSGQAVSSPEYAFRGCPVAAADELHPPSDPRANHPSQHLPSVPEKLPRPHVAQLCPCPRRNSSARDRATTGPSPPLTSNTLGQTTTANREGVSQIAYPPRLFACPRLTSPPASLPLPSGSREGKARVWVWL
jgi:hypothetical protein